MVRGGPGTVAPQRRAPRLLLQSHDMTAIRVIFDGKAFVPQQPVTLPEKSEALVFVDQPDPGGQAELDRAVRAYYQQPEDCEDAAWAKAIAPQSRSAWDED